jgi:hypothetical protein
MDAAGSFSGPFTHISPPMKLASLLATTVLLLTPILHAQEPREVVEATLSYSLKYHVKQPPLLQGQFNISTAKVFAIKTADIIDLIGLKEGKSFTKKARLIYQDTHLNSGISVSKFLIRDGGTDHFVTTYLDNFLPLFPENAFIISKGKLHATTGVGKVTQLTIHEHNIALEGLLSNPSQGFELIGPGTLSYKTVASTKLETPVLMIVPSASFVFSGRAFDVEGTFGYVTGTVRLTGAKILK